MIIKVKRVKVLNNTSYFLKLLKQLLVVLGIVKTIIEMKRLVKG
jgi:hypothetical protein